MKKVLFLVLCIGLMAPSVIKPVVKRRTDAPTTSPTPVKAPPAEKQKFLESIDRIVAAMSTKTKTPTTAPPQKKSLEQQGPAIKIKKSEVEEEEKEESKEEIAPLNNSWEVYLNHEETGLVAYAYDENAAEDDTRTRRDFLKDELASIITKHEIEKELYDQLLYTFDSENTVAFQKFLGSLFGQLKNIFDDSNKFQDLDDVTKENLLIVAQIITGVDIPGPTLAERLTKPFKRLKEAVKRKTTGVKETTLSVLRGLRSASPLAWQKFGEQDPVMKSIIVLIATTTGISAVRFISGEWFPLLKKIGNIIPLRHALGTFLYIVRSHKRADYILRTFKWNIATAGASYLATLLSAYLLVDGDLKQEDMQQVKIASYLAAFVGSTIAGRYFKDAGSIRLAVPVLMALMSAKNLGLFLDGYKGKREEFRQQPIGVRRRKFRSRGTPLRKIPIKN